MKLIKSAAIPLLLLALGLPKLASAADAWYVSGDWSRATYSGLKQNNGAPIGPYQNDSVGAYRLATGIAVNDDVTVEFGYVSFSDAYAGTVPELGNGQSCCVLGSSSDVVSAAGLVVEAVGTYPLSPSWSLFGRAGGFYAGTTIDHTLVTGAFSSMTSVYNYNHLEATVGLGVRWNFAQYWGAHLAWDYYAGAGSNDYTSGYSVRTLAVGVDYYF